MRLMERITVALVFVLFIPFPIGCGTDWNYKHSGVFEIENPTVGGNKLRLSEDKNTVILEVGKDQLTITPRWVLTGIEIVVVFQQNGELGFTLLGFRIDNQRLREKEPSSDETKSYPWHRYYFTREGPREREELHLPLTLREKTWLGFVAGVRDDPPELYQFSFTVSGNGHRYDIEFSARRRT